MNIPVCLHRKMMYVHYITNKTAPIYAKNYLIMSEISYILQFNNLVKWYILLPKKGSNRAYTFNKKKEENINQPHITYNFSTYLYH